MAFRSKRKRINFAFLMTREGVWKVVLSVLLLSLFIVHIRFSLLQQLAFTEGNGQKHFIEQQNNPGALSNLADRAYLASDDPGKALTLYMRALQALSIHVPAWIGIAEIEAEQGEKAKAVRISNYIDTISPDTGYWRWERTMLAFSLEQNYLLAANLSWFIENDRKKRKEALALATEVWQDPHDLLREIGVRNSPHALHYYMEQQEVNKAKSMWETVLQNNFTEQTNPLSYADFLIKNNEIESASQVWNTFYKNEQTLLSNGAFEDDFVGSGFGWRLRRGYKNMAVRKANELTIQFPGTENMVFNLHQLIPVTPGMTYTLSGLQKATNITTDQTPYWKVTDYNCNKFTYKSEMAVDSTSWESFDVTFPVPELCHAILISLRRNKSFHFDNKIAGELSVKNLKLAPYSKYDSIIGEVQ